MKIAPALLLVLLCLLMSGCELGKDVGEVELYLLESYETLEGSCEIKNSSVVTRESPLVTYEDFLTYNADEFFFMITDEAKESIQSLQHSVRGLAFAITSDREVVYTGYFWPSYSSLGCNWVVIDRLGYPGYPEGSEIIDHRNDRRILDQFRRDGKLVE
jgi:hypothetical protein